MPKGRGLAEGSASKAGYLSVDVGEDPNDPPTSPIELVRQSSSTILQASPLLRSLSSSVGMRPPVETINCGICFENVPKDKSHAFTGDGGCDHRFCNECLGGYLRSAITDGNTAPPCPYFNEEGGGCPAHASPEDVKALISDPQILDKFERFALAASNKEFRECPNASCRHMMLPDHNLFGRVKPQMSCSKCSTEFCYYHSISHPNESCRDFIRRTVREDQVSEKLISSVCKECPRCKFPTEKNKGCNHMTCFHCKCDWCWLCNKDISGKVSDHYSPTNLAGCANAQFSRSNGECLTLTKILNVLIVLLALGIYIPLQV